MRVAIASINPRTLAFVSLLQEQGVQTEACDDLDDVSELAGLYDLDMLLLDVALAGADGSAIAGLRLMHATVPILVLGADIGLEQSIGCFAAGVDDIVALPCRIEILAARIRAIVRRFRGADPAICAIGPLRFDMIRRSLRLDGVPITLTSKEYELLEAMVLRKGAILTKDVLLDQLYGGRDAPNARTIDVFVCKLRKKLAACGVHDLIETVRGLGYILNDTPPDRPSTAYRPGLGFKGMSDAAQAA
ncbi:response regulator transcription factor [Lichenicola cladoniae]|uniref:Response regulator transcription factor n=1 Tax=Lichenicola cladoniae TaxID=1484109 RepID=A0A6M8HLY5_9PROT|nr:response regulator transcription factor [Lichenicola cladoniae]NPD69976.1 response regulator transcription factor [Acetobacteraceae bacterium]QKE89393.1 response regulator transcription factor [Lichenicola cladoniae]